MAGSQISTKRSSIAAQYLKRSAQILGSVTGQYFSEATPTISGSATEIHDSLNRIRSSVNRNSVIPKIRQLSLQLGFRKLNAWFLGVEDEMATGSGGEELEYDTETEEPSALTEISAGDRQATQVSRAVVESSHRMVEAQISATANLMTSVEHLEATIDTGFKTLNETLGKLIEISTANSAAIIEVTAEGLADRAPAPAPIDDKGKFRASNYAKLVASNLDGTLGGLKVGASILKSGSVTPELIAGVLVDKLVPQNLKQGLGELDNTVSDLLVSSLIKLGEKSGGTDPMGILGKIFGIRSTREKGSTDKGDLELKSMQFNTLSQESLVSAIPGYLQRILKQLGGGDVSYDFKGRKFTTRAAMQREYQNKLTDPNAFARAGGEVKSALGGEYNRPEIRNMVFDLMVEDFSRSGTAEARSKLMSGSGQELIDKLLENVPNAKRLKRANAADITDLGSDIDNLRANPQAVAQLMNQVNLEIMKRNQRLSSAQEEAIQFHRDGSTMKDSNGGAIDAILENYGLSTGGDSALKGSVATLASSGVDYSNLALHEIHGILRRGINVYQVGRASGKRQQAEPFEYAELAAPNGLKPNGQPKKPKLAELLEEAGGLSHRGEGGAGGPTGEDGSRLTIEKDGFKAWGKAAGKDFVQSLFSGDAKRIRESTGQLLGEATSFAGKKLKAFFGEKDKDLKFTDWLKEKLFGRTEFDDQGQSVKKSRGILGSLDEYVFGPGGVKDMAGRVKTSTAKWFKSAMGYFNDGSGKDDSSVAAKRKSILGASFGAMAGLGLLGGPLGLIAGGIAGSAISGTNGIGDKIKDMLFGKDYTDKKGRQKHKLGILERVVNSVTDPLRYQLGKTATALGAMAKKNILGPLANLGEAIKDRVANAAASKVGKVFGWLFSKGSKLVQSIALSPFKFLGLGGAAVRGGAGAATGAFGMATNFLANRIAKTDEAKAKLKANRDRYKADYRETIDNSEYAGGQRAWIRKQNELRKSRGGMQGLMGEELNADIHTTAEKTEELVEETREANAKEAEVSDKLKRLADAGLEEGSIFTHDQGIHERLDQILEAMGHRSKKEEENQFADSMAGSAVTAATAGEFDSDDIKDVSAVTDMAARDGVSKPSLVAKVKGIFKRNEQDGESKLTGEKEEKESFLSKLLSGAGSLLSTIFSPGKLLAIGAGLLTLFNKDFRNMLGEGIGGLIDWIANGGEKGNAILNAPTSVLDVKTDSPIDYVNPLTSLKHVETDAAGNDITNLSATNARNQALTENIRRGAWNRAFNTNLTPVGASPYQREYARGQRNLNRSIRAEARGNTAAAERYNSRYLASGQRLSEMGEPTVLDQHATIRGVAGVGASLAVGQVGGKATGWLTGQATGVVLDQLGIEGETAENIEGMASRTGEAIGTIVTTQQALRNKGLAGKAKEALIKALDFILTKLAGNAKFAAAMGAIEGFIKGIKDKVLGKMSEKLSAALAKAFGKETAKAAAGVSTAGIGTAVLAVGGAVAGGCTVEKLFGVLPGDASPFMTVIASALGAIFMAVPYIGLVEILDIFIQPITGKGIRQWIAQTLYELCGGGDDLAEKQGRMSAELTAYNEKYGTNLNASAFNDMVNQGFGSKLLHGGTRMTTDGHVITDEAGAVVTTGGLTGLFSGRAGYAHDAEGNVLRNENGEAILGIDRTGRRTFATKLDENGNEMFDENGNPILDKNWGNYVGDAWHSFAGFITGEKTYKTDENGNVMYDENNQPILESQGKNIFGKAGDAVISAKNAVGGFLEDAGQKVGGILGQAKNAVGEFLFGKQGEPEPEAEAELTDNSGKKIGGLGGLIGRINGTLRDRFASLNSSLDEVTGSTYELDENGQPLLDENGEKVKKGGLQNMLKRAIGGIGSTISKTVGGILDTVKEKGLVGAAKDGLAAIGDKLSGRVGGQLRTEESQVIPRVTAADPSSQRGKGQTTDSNDNEAKFKELVNGDLGLTDRYIQKLSPPDTERISSGLNGKAVKNLFYQGNYGRTKHMSDAGCGPISAAFMTSLYGQTLTPMTAAEIMNQAQWRDASGATSLGGIEALGNKLGLNLVSSSPDANLLMTRLKRGEPVILLGKSIEPGSPFTADGHYLVATGVDRDGFISVMDPLSETGKRYKLVELMTGLQSMTYSRHQGLPALVGELEPDGPGSIVSGSQNLRKTFAPVNSLIGSIGQRFTRTIEAGKQVSRSIASSFKRLFGKGEGEGYGPGENEHIDLLHDFPIYLQGGQAPWATKPYVYPEGDQSMTMARAACGPTSMAMVLAGATGEHFSPAVAADYSMQHGYRVNGGTAHGYFKDIADKYGLETDKRSFNGSLLDQSLSEGKPVIVSGRGARPFTKSGHFVTVVGKAGDRYLVNDPANHSGEYQTLTGATNMWPFARKDGTPILGRSSYNLSSPGITSGNDGTSPVGESESTGLLSGIFKVAKDVIAKFKSVFGLDVITSDGMTEDERNPESDQPADGGGTVARIDGPVEYLTTRQVAAIQTKREAKEIIDLKTMKVINFSWAASPDYHSDCTPMTSKDVQTIKDILHPGGGVDWNDTDSWSWDGRPGVLKLNGRLIACGFHLRPHAQLMGGNPGLPFVDRSNDPYYYSSTEKWPVGGHICCYYGDSPGGTQSCNEAARQAYELGNKIFKDQKLAQAAGAVTGAATGIASSLAWLPNPASALTGEDATGAEEGIGGYGEIASPLNKAFHVTSPFGPRSGGHHNGIDLAPDDHSRQAMVHVAEPGTVDSRGFHSTAGNYVTVNGQDGRLYQYYHLKQGSSLRVGQPVQAGEPVGEMGSTGRSTGPHLHFGIKENGQFIDPAPFLSGVTPADGTVSPSSPGTEASSAEFTPDPNGSIIGQGFALVNQTAKSIANKLMTTLGLNFNDSGSSISSTQNDSGSYSQDLKAFKSVAGDNAATIYNFLTAQGCSTAAACGVLGNCRQESGLRPDIKQYGGGPGRGLFQWEEGSTRFSGLEKVAAKNHKDWTDINSQLEFLWQELTGSDINNRFKGRYSSYLPNDFEGNLTKVGGRGLPGGFADWMKLNDIKLATSNFEGAFERASSPNMTARWKYAQEFYDRFSQEARVTPVNQRTAEVRELTETGDDSYGGIGGATDVPSLSGQRIGDPGGATSSLVGNGSQFSATGGVGGHGSQPSGPSSISSRYAPSGGKARGTVGKSLSFSSGTYRPSTGTAGIKPVSPVPNSDEWLAGGTQAPDLGAIETVLGQVLLQLQAISSNTQGANGYLSSIDRKTVVGDRKTPDSSFERGTKQLDRALHRQQQLHPRGSNPFPYNSMNVSSVMSIVRPT